MKSLLLSLFFFMFLAGCSDPKNGYVALVPFQAEQAVDGKLLMKEIDEHKKELEKLKTIHSYIIDDVSDFK